jgi:hypothetical protein
MLIASGFLRDLNMVNELLEDGTEPTKRIYSILKDYEVDKQKSISSNVTDKVWLEKLVSMTSGSGKRSSSLSEHVKSGYSKMYNILPSLNQETEPLQAQKRKELEMAVHRVSSILDQKIMNLKVAPESRHASEISVDVNNADYKTFGKETNSSFKKSEGCSEQLIGDTYDHRTDSVGTLIDIATLSNPSSSCTKQIEKEKAKPSTE